jgi:UDPglucose--hexose-1-phosphate uridylyltransferase
MTEIGTISPLVRPSPHSLPTMRDVAAHAGVSLKTVSRVINGERFVSDDARTRVQNAVAQLDYRRNLHATKLRRTRDPQPDPVRYLSTDALECGPEMRFDLLTRQWVVVTASRQSRPNLPSGDCPFCVGGLESPQPYEVRAFSNRWPPFAAGSTVAPSLLEREFIVRTQARGAAEVILYSPNHFASLGSVGTRQIRKVIDLWAERTEALLARPGIEYVLIFENRGSEVGATIVHPHGQIYAFPFIPPTAALEAEVASKFGCPLCAEVTIAGQDPARLVTANKSFMASTRFAASWPYELVIACHEHRSDLAELDDQARDDLAAVLGDVLIRYDRLFDKPLPYMFWIHPGVHLHVHLVTNRRQADVTRFVAAGELGSGVMFNPVQPEEAALRLRSAVLHRP